MISLTGRAQPRAPSGRHSVDHPELLTEHRFVRGRPSLCFSSLYVKRSHEIDKILRSIQQYQIF